MSFKVTVSHTTYCNFPTARTLLPLSNVLIYSFLDFMREIGICNLEDASSALHASAPDEIEKLSRKCHLNFAHTHHTSGTCTDFCNWQDQILKGDKRRYRIDLSDVLARAIARNKYYKYDSIEHEVELALLRAQKMKATL